MRIRARLAIAAIGLAAVIAGCNGGSTSAPVVVTGPTATPSPAPTATPVPTSATGTLTTSAVATTSLTLGPIGPGNTGTVTAGASTPATSISVVFSLTQPASAPTPASVRRVPQNIGGTVTPFGYFQLTANPGTTLPGWPGFTFVFAAGQTLPPAANSYVAVYDPGNAAAGYTTIEGPASATGSSYTWTSLNTPVTFVAGRTYTFVLFTSNTTLSTPSPTPSPSPTPTPVPTATPTPPPTPPAGAIGASTSSLAFTTAGATLPFNVTENNYTGTLTAAAPSCAGIATVSPSSGAGPIAAFTVTSVAAGTCTIVVSDNHGGSVGVSVTVTTTTGTISTVKRQQ